MRGLPRTQTLLMLSCAANMHSVASEASSQLRRWFGSPLIARTNWSSSSACPIDFRRPLPCFSTLCPWTVSLAKSSRVAMWPCDSTISRSRGK